VARIVIGFNRQVLAQQPLRVLSGIAGDAAKLFAMTRDTSPGDTPISRWQFQAGYPTFKDAVELNRDHFIVLGPFNPVYGSMMFKPLPASLGGRAVVTRPLAAFLRSYQLNGGYAPGPLLALAAVAGLAGTLSIGSCRSRISSAERDLALASLLVFTTAAAILLTADVFEFSWRYQLPALITLPPAGGLGMTIVLSVIMHRRNSAARDRTAASSRGQPRRSANSSRSSSGSASTAAPPAAGCGQHEPPRQADQVP
jgi:hypothetical protein